VRADLEGLAREVVEHVHLELELRVETPPEFQDVRFVRAQPDDDPHGQRAQRAHGRGEVAVGGQPVGDDREHRLLRAAGARG
jgi:hypothetical protein